jgi:hypothetical protein
MVFNLNNLMADDFYKLMKIYEDYNMPGTQGNYPGNVGSYSGSYNQPAANGPGHEPVHPTGGNPSTGDIVEFPHKDVLSTGEMLDIVEELIEELIKRADKQQANNAKAKLKKVYEDLLDLKMHENTQD